MELLQHGLRAVALECRQPMFGARWCGNCGEDFGCHAVKHMAHLVKLCPCSFASAVRKYTSVEIILLKLPLLNPRSKVGLNLNFAVKLFLEELAISTSENFGASHLINIVICALFPIN